MSLKDATPFNIQFKEGRPLWIDTLSFEIYQEGNPWIAYRQFCETFLAPLALMSYGDLRMNRLLADFSQGIPLDLAASLLPWKSRFSSLALHLHLQAKTLHRNFASRDQKTLGKMSRSGMLRILEDLENLVSGLKPRAQETTWRNYEEIGSYETAGLLSKKKIVSDFLQKIPAGMLWDLGANQGLFSKLAAEKSPFVIAFEKDPAAAENHYQSLKENKIKNVLPLVMDLLHPSPALGWENEEQASFLQRGPAQTALALALIHHLAISEYLPLPHIASFFSKICRHLIVEFVPKDDPKTQLLLSRRPDIYPDYHSQAFEKSFSKHFKIHASCPIENSSRTLYWMEKI